MKKIMAGLLIVVLVYETSFAFVGAVAGGAQTIQTAIYQKFMMLKAVQALMLLRQNYLTSLRYYEMFKELNKGQGLIKNLAKEIEDLGREQVEATERQFDFDWNHEGLDGTKVEKLVRGSDDYVSGQMLYASAAFKNALMNQKKAEEIASGADNMNPKALQTTGLKAQSLQVQMQAQNNRHLAALIGLNAQILKLLLEEKNQRLQDQEDVDQSLKKKKK